MGFKEAANISFSGMKTSLEQVEIASSNIANSLTTRSVEGGPYRRRTASIEEVPLSFQQVLDRANARVSGGGVRVREISEDPSPFQRVYQPGHPDADADGFVNLPNVRHSEEITNLLYYSRLYEANLTAYNVTKRMMQDTLQIQ